MVIDIHSSDYVHPSGENDSLDPVFDYSGKQRMTAKLQPILQSAGHPLLEPVAQRTLLPLFPGHFD